MKGSLSRKKITEFFDEFDGRLTVVSYCGDGQTNLSYMHLNTFRALAHVATMTTAGFVVIILLDVPDDFWVPRHIDDIPDSLIWSPSWEDCDRFQTENFRIILTTQ